MALGTRITLALMGRSKEMPQDVADYLAGVVKPRRAAIGSQTDAARAWGVSQSHISQIENGAGCGSAVLIALRGKLNLSLEELCFPPGKRKGIAAVESPPAPQLDLDAIRAALRAELDDVRRDSTPPTDPPAPLKKGPPSDAPRARRR
jgi:DNA-binding XRE family transcriptional regulator